MPGPEVVPCPACGAGPGVLSIVERLVASPLGSFSLAGAGLKVSARWRPVLVCAECGWEDVGVFDGRHALFPRGARGSSE